MRTLLLLLAFCGASALLSRTALQRVRAPLASEEIQPSSTISAKLEYGMRVSRRSQAPLRDLLGFGPAEIALTLVVALVLFGPETLKSLSKDVGRAAAELKEIPKTFKEGMDEGAESAQVSRMKAIAAEKRKKRDAKVAAAGQDDEEEETEGEKEEA